VRSAGTISGPSGSGEISVRRATEGVPVPNDRTGGRYMNWPDPDLLEEEWNQSGVPWSELYYGRNYKKLQEAKSRWDPHQVFNYVLSVEPG
jgi:hypothetical protein